MKNEKPADCRWTLQEVTTLAGKPWYALLLQSDDGVERQHMGYRWETDARAVELGIVPEKLPAITAMEFFSRFGGGWN